MNEFKGPDVKAPRFRQKAVKIINDEFFKNFKEKYPKYKDIKLKYFDEEIRWNFYAIFPESENYTDNPIIVMHYSGQKAGLE